MNAFVKEFLDSSGSKDCAMKYLNIDSSYFKDEEQKKFFFEWFAAYSLEMKKETMKNNGNYKIISHMDESENNMIKKYNLETDDYSGVFYLITGDKIATSIIIKNRKIISYCPLLNLGRADLSVPWFINEPFVQKKNENLKGMNLLER